MKRFVLVGLIALNICAMAQTAHTPTTIGKASVETRALIQAMGHSKSMDAVPPALRALYPVHTLHGVPTIGVIAKVDSTFDAQDIADLGGNARSRLGHIVSMRLPIAALSALEQVQGITTYTVAHWAAPMLEEARFDVRADSVHQGLGLEQPFNGEGVLIGITDWGFDYTHPNLNKQRNPRIERAWDHYRLSGPAPEGFDYGTEIIGHADLKAAGGDTSNLYNYGTHGTHVAGIAAGNGSSDGQYVGMAPAAHMLMGSWLLDEASWIDQVYWMWQVAKEEQKRLVINSSWGMYTFSNLDGTSLLSQAINSLSDSGVVFVTSAGNNGDARCHIKRTFSHNGDTLRTIPTWYNYSTAVGQALIMWGTPGQEGAPAIPFRARFGMARNDAEIYWSHWISSHDTATLLNGLLPLANGDTCRWNALCETENINDGRPHILLNVNSVPGYTLHLWITADSGTRVDAWNVVNLQNHAGNMGADFVSRSLENYTNGDYLYSVSEPGCAASTITVAAHRADRLNNAGEYTEGVRADFSSRGPAFGETPKPEISAPGYGVVSSISSRTTEPPTNVSLTVMASGRPYTWAPLSGTSMSSPAVAGIVALMLQANPNLSVAQVRDILFSTARNDSKTGDIHTQGVPDNEWGWGKADALRAVTAAYARLDVAEAQKHTPQLLLYPNPAQDAVTVITTNTAPETLNLYTIDGHHILQRTIHNGENLSTRQLSKGIYIVRTTGQYGSRVQKLVIQ